MNVTDFWDGISNNPGNPVFEGHRHECFQGSYLSQRNNYCSIGRLIVQNRGGIETNGWGSRYLDYNYRDEEHTNRVNPVWCESHLDVQTDRAQEKYFPGIAGIAFINHVSEIHWISTRGGSRNTSDCWDAYRDYYPGLPIWENFFGTYLYQNLDRFAGGMGRLLISNRGGTGPDTIGSRYRTIYTQ